MVRTADKLMGALGLARRAGAMAVGFDAVCDQAQKAAKPAADGKLLVLLAADLSPKTAKRIHLACKAGCTVRTIPYGQQQLVPVAGKPAGVLAITNKDLATLCLGALPQAADEEEAD